MVLVALLSLLRPDFLLPAAVSATVFYLLAGFWHARHKSRSFNQSFAMATDLVLGLLFGAIAVIGLMNTGIDLVW